MDFGCPGALESNLPNPAWIELFEPEPGLVYALTIERLDGGEKQERN